MSRESEIREAIVAANEALEHLRAAADELNSAGRWGMVDMMGGGFFTSAIKHGRLSNAQDEIQEAKRALKRFSRELRDVDEDAGLNVEVGGLLGFFDVFMDNPLSDLLVQSRIGEVQEQLERAIRQITVARDRLCRM